jgi:hypothetical protein
MRTYILMPIMIFMTESYHSFSHLLRSFSEHHIKAFLFSIFTGYIILMSSCEGDPTMIGSKLLPKSDFISVKSTDTLSVRSYTMYSDSIKSDNPSVSYVGYLYDPYFGKTTAEFVSQLRLATTWTAKYFVVDSVKLYLSLMNVKGSVNRNVQLVMSEIAEQIYTDSTYYSSQNVPLTGFSVSCQIPDSLQADTINNIVMNVPVSFGKYLIRDTSMLFHSSSKPDFRSFFKGIYFQLESTEPLLLSLSVAPPSSGYGYSNFFYVYMHDANGTALTPFTFVLDAVSRNAAFNRYIHDFNAAEPTKKIEHINDTNYLDTLSYVQIMNGLYAKLTIPGLKGIKDDPSMDGISVNKARLIFPVVYDDVVYKPSTIPSQVYLRYLTSSGSKNIIPDYLISPSFFDGTPDTTANVYKVNLAAYVQAYLDDKNNTLKPEVELFLSASASKNVILKANKSHSPVKFDFTYSKF